MTAPRKVLVVCRSAPYGSTRSRDAIELAMAFGRNGWTKGDVKSLSEGDILARLLPVIRGQIDENVLLVPSLTFAADFIPEYPQYGTFPRKKWEIVRDVSPSSFDIAKLKPFSFLKKGEVQISGGAMRDRAAEHNCNWGLCDGKRLWSSQKEIPAEFQDFFIPLTGTVLRDEKNLLRIPVLFYQNRHFHGNHLVEAGWSMKFEFISCDWGKLDRFARIEQ